MITLDKRNETYGLDIKIHPDMAPRAEVMLDAINSKGSGVSVQELINALCDLIDGDDVHDIVSKTGLAIEYADRIDEIRNAIRPLWTHADGTKVTG